MARLGKYLRTTKSGHAHWCPGCVSMHIIPNSWSFTNGDLERPSFQPSVKHLDKVGGTESECHYHIIDGSIKYYNDCKHTLKDQTIPMVNLDLVEMGEEHAFFKRIDPTENFDYQN